MFLHLSHLTIRYPGQAAAAVSDVSLELGQGEIGVLIGPSGCGKTTLLRSIAGLTAADAGEVRIAGERLSSPGFSVPAETRRIGMVFQDYALFPHLNVERNILFGLHGLERPLQSRRVSEVLELVGLTGNAARYPHELSGGQQQRVALARALAPKPRLMLLDEPFSSLDVELRERLAQEMRSILKEAEVTALFVTHDQLEAFAIGDFIGVMQAGQLQQWDQAYSLYHRPATRFVASFIGHGVFVPAMRLEGDEGGLLRTVLGDLPLPKARGSAEGSDRGSLDEYDVLLRADDVVHDDDSPTKARVMRKLFRGSEFLYTLETSDGLSIQAHVPSHHNHSIGEWIGVKLQADHVVTFPRETGASNTVLSSTSSQAAAPSLP